MLDVASQNSPASAPLHEPTPATLAPGEREADVVIVGAGLSGVTAAVVLGRAGYRVVLVDRHASCPPQFRVEAISGRQVDALRRLGLLDCIAEAGAFVDHVVNARRGRVIDRSYGPQYSLRYEDMVRVVREQLPPAVECVVDRVSDISTGSELQHVVLANQGIIAARLVVLATGLSDFLGEKLGMTRIVTSEKHSISFGFDLTPGPGRRIEFPALVYYGETAADRIDYVHIFPIGAVMRANLFTFRDDRDPWIRRLMQAPKQTLLATLPGLADFLGDFEVMSPVRSWVMNLYQVDGYEQQGVVLVGDAFQTSCPAAGTGVARLLTDVERLCGLHAPHWLASRGMGREKIAEFYGDPTKQAEDRRSIALAHHRRLLTADTGLGWTVRRQQHFLRRRVGGWIQEVGGAEQRP